MFEIIDQQDDFIVINKPAGLGFHDDEIDKGVHNQLKAQLELVELYPVHRLDKLTSGLLIFAKTKQAAQTFQKLFEQKQIQKFYLAVSDQKPKKKQGVIKGDMEKSRRGMWKLTRTMHNPAISQFFSYSIGAGKRLFLIKPHTGKTHQIRVALSSIGSPILGDNYYGKNNAERGYLHAFALSFFLDSQLYQYILPPIDGQNFTDKNSQKVINNIALPWQLPWPKI